MEMEAPSWEPMAMHLLVALLCAPFPAGSYEVLAKAEIKRRKIETLAPTREQTTRTGETSLVMSHRGNVQKLACPVSCFNAHGGMYKNKTKTMLKVFEERAVLLMDFIGWDDVSEFHLFIIGHYFMDARHRAAVTVVICISAVYLLASYLCKIIFAHI